MFESLSDRLQDVFRQIRGDARLTEQSVETALREIRMALLEADVNFKVVKAFIDRVRDRAVGEDVLKSLTPAQQVVADRPRRVVKFSATPRAAAAIVRRAARHPAPRSSGFR